MKLRKETGQTRLGESWDTMRVSIERLPINYIFSLLRLYGCNLPGIKPENVTINNNQENNLVGTLFILLWI